MAIIDVISARIFKQRDMTQLKDHNMIDILRTCSSFIYTQYIAAHKSDELNIIEFLCIRIVYLALSMDEMSSDREFYALPHHEIHRLVSKAWYTDRMNKYEFSIMDFCGWNPIRYCRDNNNIITGSPLYDYVIPKKLT